jgi:hypothetical protein
MNEGDVVDYLTERGHDVAHQFAAPAISLEVEGGLHPWAEPVLESLDVLAEIGRLAMPLDQFGLEIKQIEMARRARHEQLHDPFGTGRVMQDLDRTLGRKQIVRIQQAGEGDSTQTARALKEHFTARLMSTSNAGMRKCGRGLHRRAILINKQA